MSDDSDLERYVKELRARWLEPDRIPGGGRGVELFDPSGRSVLLQGAARRALPLREALAASTNTPTHAPRVNRAVARRSSPRRS